MHGAYALCTLCTSAIIVFVSVSAQELKDGPFAWTRFLSLKFLTWRPESSLDQLVLGQRAGGRRAALLEPAEPDGEPCVVPTSSEDGRETDEDGKAHDLALSLLAGKADAAGGSSGYHRMSCQSRL